jgi:hypothetical protein
MEFLFGILILILNVVAIVDAIKGSLPVEKKALWVILILFLPALGLMLYYLVGKTGK